MIICLCAANNLSILLYWESEVKVIIGVEVDVDGGLRPVKVYDLLLVSGLLYGLVVAVPDETRET